MATYFFIGSYFNLQVQVHYSIMHLAALVAGVLGRGVGFGSIG
jgi:hypothetical protein